MKKILPIIKLAAKFSEIQRTSGYKKGHFENNAEHSYQITLVCWSLNEQYNLGLSDEKILKYALVHDLVEVYAGDTDSFGDPKQLQTKKAREAAALLSLKDDYGEFKAMIKAIEEYEAKQNLEAELVYTMEKLVTETNVYNCRGDYFFERKIDIISWKKWLLGKINYENLNLNIKPIVDEAIAEIEENHKNIFYAG